MGRRAEFDAINRRIAAINRKGGDRSVAFEVVYGDSNAVYFVQNRASYAAAEQGLKTFDAALRKVLGEAALQKMYTDWDATVESEREELWQRRADFSAGAPDAAGMNRLIGEARWIRIVNIQTRSGKASAFASQLRIRAEMQQRANPGVAFLASETVAGNAAGTFHVVTMLKSLGDLDRIKPLPQNSDAQNNAAETIERMDVVIGRFLPELSNPGAEVIAVDPKFWNPNPAPAKSKASPKQ